VRICLLWQGKICLKLRREQPENGVKSSFLRISGIAPEVVKATSKAMAP